MDVSGPGIDVNGAASMLGVSYPHANAIIRDMADLGIVREGTGQRRHRVFVYRPYLALFSDL